MRNGKATPAKPAPGELVDAKDQVVELVNLRLEIVGRLSKLEHKRARLDMETNQLRLNLGLVEERLRREERTNV